MIMSQIIVERYDTEESMTLGTNSFPPLVPYLVVALC